MNWGAIEQIVVPTRSNTGVAARRLTYNVLERTPLRGFAQRLRESCKALSPVIGGAAQHAGDGLLCELSR